jgi:glycosyltransferase involved in cell wall biosynthesis
MRIGIVSELFPPMFIGGGEISAYYLATGLAKKGHMVVVITPNYGKGTNVERIGHLTVIRFAFPNVMKKQIITRLMSTPYGYFKFANAVKAAVRKYGLEILHAQNSLSYLPVALSGQPGVATLRDYSSFCDCGICSLERRLERHWFPGYLMNKMKWQASKFMFYPTDYLNLLVKQFALRRMKGVIAISRTVAKIYRKMNLSSEVIYNTIDIKDVTTSKEELRKKYGLPDGFIVLYVGKLSRGKGIRDYLAAAERIDAGFVIIGDGPLKSEVLKAGKGNPRIIYLGKMPHERVLEVCKASDAVCFPSVWEEPLGRVAIESLALGIPCLASNVGGIPEIIDDGVNGFLFEPGRPGQIAGKLKLLMSDEKLRETFSRNGKKKVKGIFDSSKIIAQHEKFYEKVLA